MATKKKTSVKKSTTKPDLLSSGKVAEKLGVSATALKKAIAAAGVKPDAIKGVCSYYNASSISKIQKAL